MARVRNKTSNELDLRLSGFTATVKPDESVDVPDAIYAAHAWPESTWDVIEDHKAHRKPAGKPDDATDNEEK